MSKLVSPVMWSFVVLLVCSLYWLNKHDTQKSDDPIYVRVLGSGLYVDPIKLRHGIVGFLLPVLLYVGHIAWFLK